MASAMTTASSSGPAQTTSSTGSPGRALGPEALVGLEAGLVPLDQPVGGLEDVVDRAEVLLEPEARRRAGRPGDRVVDRRPREARVELGEGGEARAAEAVDRLVVVADDHHVVGPVGRPAEHLDELDLGDVGVLELVDEDVAELALPATQHVRADLEQLGDGGDLLAEVECAAPDELGLVGPVDRRELGQAHDLEGCRVLDVGRGQGVDRGVQSGVELGPRVRVAVAADRPAGLAVGGLLDVELGVGREVRAKGVGELLGGWSLACLGGREHAVRVGARSVAGRVDAGQFLVRAVPFRVGALVAAEVRVGLADLARCAQVALPLEPLRGGLVGAVALLEDAPLLGDDGLEVRRRDELVLGPVDERDELGQPPVGVVDERELGPDVAQEEDLADAVEHVRVRRQPGVRRRLGQHPVAEAVEVRDGHPRPRRRPDGVVEPSLELLRRLDVVRQDEDLLGDERRVEGVVAVGRRGRWRVPEAEVGRWLGHRGRSPASGQRRLGPLRRGPGRPCRLGREEATLRIERPIALRVEQPAHPLDDDPRLARPRPGDDDERPIHVLDNPALLGGQDGGGLDGSHSNDRPMQCRWIAG